MRLNKDDLLFWLCHLLSMTLFVLCIKSQKIAEFFYAPEAKSSLFYFVIHLSTLILFFLIPVLLIKFVHKKPLSSFYLSLGDWKKGISYTGLLILLVTYPTYLSCQKEDFLNIYPLSLDPMKSTKEFIFWSFHYFLYYLGYEFYFRGYLLKKFSSYSNDLMAIAVTTMYTVLLHIGKPAGETLGSLIAGIAFGLMVIKTKSIWWPLLFHWYLGIITTYFAGIKTLSLLFN